MQRRRTILILLLAGLVPAFLVTGILVRSYKESRQQLGVEWASRGDVDLEHREPQQALDAFRTALSYADDRSYRLRLAQALVASDRPSEAEAHLLTLWSDEPGSGIVNLELARLQMARGDIADAIRYYHAAIDGAWPSNAATERRKARFELARRLIAAGRRDEAQPELIALGEDVSNDPVQLTEVGELLAQAGADTRALTVLRQALALAPDNARAAALAGDLAFRLGDLDAARRYLGVAARGTSLPSSLSDELALSDRVLALDPFARGIPLRERARRTLEIFDVARARLEKCQSGAAAAQAPALDDLAATVDRIEPRLGKRAAERDDDLVDEALDAAFRIEQLPAGVCGDPSLDDRAIALLARELQSR